jgi:hypothetical protein
MYDLNTGKYNFDEANRREQAFLVKNGQQALDYIDTYNGAKWTDKPAELKMLEQARDILKPYWGITDAVWSMYPAGLKDLSDKIQLMENQGDPMAKQVLRKYPSILRARELIATYKQRMRQQNPMIQQAYNLFY